MCPDIPCLLYRYTCTDDSDELYPSFFMARKSLRLDLFDSEDRITCPVETLMTICQSTRRHIAEDLNLANICRYKHHEGVWGSGSTASLILILDVVRRLGGQLHATPALFPGESFRYIERSVRR